MDELILIKSIMHQVYMILFDDWSYWFSPVILLTWHHCYKGPISKTWGRPCSQEGSSCRFGKWWLFWIDQWNPVKAKRCMCWDGFRTRKGIASMSLVSCFCLIWEVMNYLNSFFVFLVTCRTRSLLQKMLNSNTGYIILFRQWEMLMTNWRKSEL